MCLRKFYFTLSLVMSFFLFITGSFILLHINSLNQTEGLYENARKPINELLKPFIAGNDPVNFLVLVGDKQEANTDTMLLVNFNPATDRLNILSIPRDTKVNIPGLKIPKINSIYSRKDGEKMLAEAVSDLLGVNINYYVYFNIATFRNIIDMLGGVEITVPVDMVYNDPTQNLYINLKKGRQRLDGKKAEQFLRFRHPNAGGYTSEMKKYYDGSDLKRIEAQQYFIKELIKQKANILYLPKLNSIINEIYDSVETNITLADVTMIAKNISGFSLDKLQMFTLPGESQMQNGLWYYVINKSEAVKISQENFQSKGSFSNYKKESAKKTNNSTTGKNTNNSSSKAAEPSGAPKSTNVTKDNPSNSGTSLEGSAAPAP